MADLEMREYRSNSNKSREQQRIEEQKPKTEKLDIGTVKTKKRSGLMKIRDSVIKEDAHNVGSYVMSELFLPRLIDMIADMGKGAIEMFLYGGDYDAKARKRSPGSRVSYRSYYEDDRRYRDDRDRHYNRPYDYDEITFQSRADADDVLNNLYGILDRYKYVTVADLFDSVGEPGRHTDCKWGWTDLRGSYIRRDGRDYVIELPKPMPIEIN